MAVLWDEKLFGQILHRRFMRVALLTYLTPLLSIPVALKQGGCASPPTVYPIEITVVGVQDLEIRCAGSRQPIVIVSQHCGFSQNRPFSKVNASVVFFVQDSDLVMVGWDDEGNLGVGGQVQVAGSVVHSGALRGTEWWNVLAAMDRRFAVVSTSSVVREGASQEWPP